MPQHYAYGFSPLLMTKRNKASLLSQTLQVASGKPQKRGGGGEGQERHAEGRGGLASHTVLQRLGRGGRVGTLLVSISILQEMKAPICKILKLSGVIKYSPARCTFEPARQRE